MLSQSDFNLRRQSIPKTVKFAPISKSTPLTSKNAEQSSEKLQSVKSFRSKLSKGSKKSAALSQKMIHQTIKPKNNLK